MAGGSRGAASQQDRHGADASRGAHPGDQAETSQQKGWIKNDSGTDWVCPRLSCHGIGQHIDLGSLMVLNGPAGRGQLPADIEVLNCVQSGEEGVCEGDKRQDDEKAALE